MTDLDFGSDRVNFIRLKCYAPQIAGHPVRIASIRLVRIFYIKRQKRYTKAMRRRSWTMSLARKITLLLGASVLLTISATLAFPWLQMSWLNAQAMLLQAKHVAAAAHQAVDLRQPNWVELQGQLAKLWPTLAEELDLPEQCPTLVPVQAGFAHPQGFAREAARRLAQNPHQPYFWKMQDHNRRFRFAMAVRGAVTDPHPLALRGLIDVTLPVPRASLVWNATVTALAGASGAVLAIFVFYVVSRRLILRPVEMLRSVAEKVARGDITVQSSIQSGDEFQELSNTFNDMLAHLRTAQEEQRTINRSLDIRLGELAETNVGLYESNRLKSEFLGNVSHELRTPLVSIIGFAELLRDCCKNAEPDRNRTVRYADHILTSGRSLLEIINDLLDLAKIEAGKLELHISEFSMTQLGTDLVDFVQPLVDKRRQHIELHLADDLPLMRSDSGKIKQILYNLLSNAIKFTPEEGLVMLRLENTPSEGVRIIVSDTGPGIAADQHERIFEKFRQLDASNTREHEGTGLGLAITRELVTVLGGTIQLDSSDGNGATFTVELPVEVPPFAQRAQRGAASDLPTGANSDEA